LNHGGTETRSNSKYFAPNAASYLRYVEVQQQTDWTGAQAHVGKQLGIMDGEELFYAFQLQYEPSLYPDVHAITAI
jgi:hypothetical protein